jgi:ATP-dependent RNA helicase TDRD9
VFELPPQCFECRLSEIIPSPLLCDSSWTKQATEFFKATIEGTQRIEVVSFVDKIASVQLLVDKDDASFCVNDKLVVAGYALTSDDSYMNQLDHFNRERKSRHVEESPQVEDEFCDVGVVPPPLDLLCKALEVDGPFSPLECKPEMICRIRTAAISVESSSVNQALIDPFPNDASKKLLVAASMSRKDDRVTLHQTTIMPHLPGMSSLLTLLFSQASEIHLTEKRDRYTTILCGLGGDENRKPLFGEHDLLVKIDVELDASDFRAINEMRFKISKLFRNISGFKFQPKVNTVNRAQLRFEICSLMLQIFTKTRHQLGIIYPKNSEWNWKPFVKNEEGFESIYPQLTFENLAPQSINTRNKSIERAERIENLARTNAKDQSVKCELCEEYIETLVDLQLHLSKKLHKERLLTIRDETGE